MKHLEEYIYEVSSNLLKKAAEKADELSKTGPNREKKYRKEQADKFKKGAEKKEIEELISKGKFNPDEPLDKKDKLVYDGAEGEYFKFRNFLDSEYFKNESENTFGYLLSPHKPFLDCLKNGDLSEIRLAPDTDSIIDIMSMYLEDNDKMEYKIMSTSIFYNGRLHFDFDDRYNKVSYYLYALTAKGWKKYNKLEGKKMDIDMSFYEKDLYDIIKK